MTSNPKERIVYRVPPARIAPGEYQGETKTCEGDIHASYSADRIADNGKIRRPFMFEGCLWVCVSMRGCALTFSNEAELEAYKILPKKLFQGTSFTYSEQTMNLKDCEKARNTPLGFYHGMIVKHAGEEVVLCGPPGTFMPGEEKSPKNIQLSLF